MAALGTLFTINHEPLTVPLDDRQLSASKMYGEHALDMCFASKYDAGRFISAYFYSLIGNDIANLVSPVGPHKFEVLFFGADGSIDSTALTSPSECAKAVQKALHYPDPVPANIQMMNANQLTSRLHLAARDALWATDADEPWLSAATWMNQQGQGAGAEAIDVDNDIMAALDIVPDMEVDHQVSTFHFPHTISGILTPVHTLCLVAPVRAHYSRNFRDKHPTIVKYFHTQYLYASTTHNMYYPCLHSQTRSTHSNMSFLPMPSAEPRVSFPAGMRTHRVSLVVAHNHVSAFHPSRHAGHMLSYASISFNDVAKCLLSVPPTWQTRTYPFCQVPSLLIHDYHLYLKQAKPTVHSARTTPCHFFSRRCTAQWQTSLQRSHLEDTASAQNYYPDSTWRANNHSAQTAPQVTRSVGSETTSTCMDVPC